VETEERIVRIRKRPGLFGDQGENRMAQTGKKPEKNRIREEDWNKYVDAVRRESARRREGKHPEEQKEV
jgi:hypothetical protein